ncbi:CaiB/BaiF CoA-transferase family protein [Mucilaginibacter sp. L196]|uniref:CaiB/BaiF CoA transferase family protein n=1 Tax=Mucilaginibacter sp. L196 TaxID=1641870 RepID=UPI00131DC90E|nr:CaiB/BaiF CoA-transferase family protein [Mucilaginibacter sp. L196]
MKPLEDYLVIDFSQFLSGPSASLKLADLGARVIKIEKPGTGDICRHLYTSNVIMNGESSVFHAINRNKESFAADIKNEFDKEQIRALVKQADVVMHNFRPGVMERLGFDYERVKQINPSVIYGEISGYGNEGPWKDKPGQDLLLQSLSGLTWLTGNAGSPVPMGLSIIDMLAGNHLAQGILACLFRRTISGEGAFVQVSMLEAAIDFQFEAITTYYYDGKLPERSEHNNAHAYLGAPYGIYKTDNGYIALAMGSIPQLGALLGCDALLGYADGAEAFNKRDEIKAILAAHLLKGTNEQWLGILQAADIWCAEVLAWDQLMQKEGFKVLDMLQEVGMSDGFKYQTTRSPIRIDGEVLKSPKGSPKLGEDNKHIISQLINRQHGK